MIEVRGAEPGDIAFIYSNWLRGQRFGLEYFESMDSDAYYAMKKEEITAVLSRPDVSVRVACADDERDMILGYVVAQILDEGASIVWLFVRPSARKQGIAKQLCEGLRVRYCGSLTKIGDEIRKKKDLAFCPVVIKYLGGTDE